MRICGACRRPIRHDESLATCWLGAGAGGAGFYSACPRCCAAEAGVDPPAPNTYPAADAPTRGYPFPVCGVCRESLYENEQPSSLRLTAEDVGESGLEPGAYHCCPRCLEKWRPTILARWVREGVIADVSVAPRRLL